MILDDFKEFVVRNSLVDEKLVKFDYDFSDGDNAFLITLYEHLPCDLAMRCGIRFTIKFLDLNTSRNTCFALHDLLFPEENFQKSIIINGKTMHLKLNKGPYYSDKDPSKRHVYVLDITVTYNR